MFDRVPNSPVYTTIIFMIYSFKNYLNPKMKSSFDNVSVLFSVFVIQRTSK